MNPDCIFILKCLSLVLKRCKTYGRRIKCIHSKMRASCRMCRLAFVADDLAHKSVSASLSYHNFISYRGMMSKIDIDIIECTNPYQFALAAAISYLTFILELIFKFYLTILLSRHRKEYNLTVKCCCNLFVGKCKRCTYNSCKLVVMSAAMCA